MTTRSDRLAVVAKFAKTREDVKTWADLLELDDFVSFGGTA